jgi:hypothetical protein
MQYVLLLLLLLCRCGLCRPPEASHVLPVLAQQGVLHQQLLHLADPLWLALLMTWLLMCCMRLLLLLLLLLQGLLLLHGLLLCCILLVKLLQLLF